MNLARGHGRTHLGDDAGRVIATDGMDVLVEATGDPRALLRHAVAAGRHLVMAAVAGPLLAERAAGCRVTAAGKGTRYHPSYHQSTPGTVIITEASLSVLGFGLPLSVPS